MGIANPPADSIAAVDPAAVETLKPLDLQCTNEEEGFSFLLALIFANISVHIMKFEGSKSR